MKSENFCCTAKTGDSVPSLGETLISHIFQMVMKLSKRKEQLCHILSYFCDKPVLPS